MNFFTKIILSILTLGIFSTGVSANNDKNEISKNSLNTYVQNQKNIDLNIDFKNLNNYKIRFNSYSSKYRNQDNSDFKKVEMNIKKYFPTDNPKSILKPLLDQYFFNVGQDKISGQYLPNGSIKEFVSGLFNETQINELKKILKGRTKEDVIKIFEKAYVRPSLKGWDFKNTMDYFDKQAEKFEEKIK